jgi:hypothetical protein
MKMTINFFTLFWDYFDNLKILQISCKPLFISPAKEKIVCYAIFSQLSFAASGIYILMLSVFGAETILYLRPDQEKL